MYTTLPAVGRDDKLKTELMHVFGESDDEKFKKLVGKEEIGYRKPSRFYHDLRKLAGPLASDKFILTLWKNRLPAQVRRFLAGVDGDDVARMLWIADEVHEDYSVSDQRAPRLIAIVEQPVRPAATGESWLSVVNALSEQITQLRAEVRASKCDHRSRRRTDPGRRNRPRSRERSGKPDFCFYHRKFENRAYKCQSPRKWM